MINLGISIFLEALTDGPIRMMDRDLISLINLCCCLRGFQLSKQTKGTINLSRCPCQLGEQVCSHCDSCWEVFNCHLKICFPPARQTAWNLTKENDSFELIPCPFISTVVYNLNLILCHPFTSYAINLPAKTMLVQM